MLYTIQQFEKNSRTLVIEITNNGEPFDIGRFSQIQLQLDKPDGTTIIEDSNSEYMRIENNTIKLLFGEHMTNVSGFMVGKIMFFDSQSMIATTLFKIRVENGLIDSSDIITPSEYDSLVALLNKILAQSENVDELYDELSTLADALSSEISRAKSAEADIKTEVGIDNFYTKSEIDVLQRLFDTIKIEVNTDVDDYADSGFYRCEAPDRVASSPTASPFFMITGISDDAYQIIYDNEGCIYHRVKTKTGTWTAWVLLNPQADNRLDNNSENPVQNKVVSTAISSINADITDIVEKLKDYYDKDEIDALYSGFDVRELTSGSDLDNCLEYGFYCYHFEENQEIANAPADSSFFMIVGLANHYPYHILFDSNNDIYLRQQYADNYSNHWTQWCCVTNPVTIDDALNTISKNPVENRVITERIDEIAELFTGYNIKEVHNYSLEEQIIGRWINGKPVYEKIIDFGYAPDTNTASKEHGIRNIEKIIDLQGFADDEDTTIPLGYDNVSDISSQIELYATKTEVGIKTGTDRSQWYIYLRLRYTKSTDTSVVQYTSLEKAINDTTFSSLVTEHKDLVSAVNEVFSSVSNGKELIAGAITDKGVDTGKNDSFQTMADNIEKIEGGEEIVISQTVTEPVPIMTINSSWTESAHSHNYYRYLKFSTNGNTLDANNEYVEVQAFDTSGTNVAYGKATGIYAIITDGDIDPDNFVELGSGQKEIIIDLQNIYNLSYIKLWHYYSEVISYHSVKVSVSLDDINYITLFDSDIDGEYVETASGKTIYL